ncbi:MAG: cytochrome B6 [Candidatus Neomarinimicrobiota bacterium]|nr:MAG: cytochrome B6 [Candidatus Neomarinimicrobiota bacterium]
MKYILIFSSFFLLISLSAEPIKPIPLTVEYNKEIAQLGKKLFFDPILSQDGTISCATCHHLENGGDDNMKFSFGIRGQEGNINSPTIYNAVYNFRQFWDGRAKDLAEQALEPIENPVEMGNNFNHLIKTLNASKYKQQFDTLYPDGITQQNIVHAIAEYEKALITPNAPFDQYLRGNVTAITEEAKEGYALFKSKGCITCHHGRNIGGNLYNKFGVIEDAKSADLGRYNVTKNERDNFFFKVPSLRNISKTAPYLHDGRAATLTEAVKIMARYQLGQPVTEEEVRHIVTFLNTLEGEIPSIAKQ